MKKTIVTAALGLGVVVSSLIGSAGVGAAPMSGTRTSMTQEIACDCTIVSTTSDLNLRSGPGTNYGVITVMPEGIKLQRYTQAGQENGFAKVYFNGSAGWASLDYLSESAGSSAGYDPSAYDESLITDVGVVTSDHVNVRTGPGTTFDILAVRNTGDQVAWTDVVVNDFRLVWHAGDMGWIHTDWVAIDEGQYDDGTGVGGPGAPAPGSTLIVISALNLRAKPTTSSKVLLVMPEGAKVTLHDDAENGFYTVTYNGITGWAYSEFLKP